MPEVRGRFFDGKTSSARAVVLRPQAGALLVEGEGVALRVPLDEVEIGEPLAHAPRIVVLRDGARCELDPGPGLELLLEVAGHRERRVSRWQRRWSVAVLCAALTLALLAFGYRHGLPRLAEHIAQRLPEEWVRALGAHTLAALDHSVFEPTQLVPAQRERLLARFEALRAPTGALPSHWIRFRAAPRIGANAFALPSGDVVVTDELVELAGRDEELIALLAHEVGHLHERHVLRGLIQGSIVGAVVALWFGDVGSLATGLPVFVLEAKYSRDFEREADAYAASLLRANGLGTQPLADLLARLAGEARSSAAPGLGAGYLSSHPATQERLRALASAEAQESGSE